MPRPLEPVAQGPRIVLGISFFVVFVAAWAFATLGGFVSRTFLADPITMLQDGWTLLTRFGFAYDIGETQKLLVIFIGSVFQVILMVAVAVGQTRRDLVDAAYTLGSTDRGVVRRVLIPANAPEIAEILRLVLGWAWTYVIVAELIGSSSGIGHMIIDSQALLATGQMIFGIIVIGVIGLISDFLFKALNRSLFPWRLA